VAKKTPVQEVRTIEENFFHHGCNGAYANLRDRMGTLYLQKFLNRYYVIIHQNQGEGRGGAGGRNFHTSYIRIRGGGAGGGAIFF
jgi:hypothetical protein